MDSFCCVNRNQLVILMQPLHCDGDCVQVQNIRLYPCVTATVNSHEYFRRWSQFNQVATNYIDYNPMCWSWTQIVWCWSLNYPFNFGLASSQNAQESGDAERNEKDRAGARCRAPGIHLASKLQVGRDTDMFNSESWRKTESTLPLLDPVLNRDWHCSCKLKPAHYQRISRWSSSADERNTCSIDLKTHYNYQFSNYSKRNHQWVGIFLIHT
jgi:hypothetical protein